MPKHSNHRSPRIRQKWHEKIFEEIIVSNFPKMDKEITIQVQETQKFPKKDEPKVKHLKAQINQTSKDQTQRANIKSSKGKA